MLKIVGESKWDLPTNVFGLQKDLLLTVLPMQHVHAVNHKNGFLALAHLFVTYH